MVAALLPIRGIVKERPDGLGFATDAADFVGGEAGFPVPRDPMTVAEPEGGLLRFRFACGGRGAEKALRTP